MKKLKMKWGSKEVHSGGVAGQTGSLFEMLSSCPSFLDLHKKKCVRTDCR